MRRSSVAPSPEEEDRSEPDEKKDGQKDATDKEMKVRRVDTTWPCPRCAERLEPASRASWRSRCAGCSFCSSGIIVGDVSDPDDHNTDATVEQCIIATSICGFT